MPYQHLLVASPKGYSVHLATARSHTALCGVPADRLELQVPFALNGCLRCARHAIREGTDRVVDVDGAVVDLGSFRPASHY